VAPDELLWPRTAQVNAISFPSHTIARQSLPPLQPACRGEVRSSARWLHIREADAPMPPYHADPLYGGSWSPVSRQWPRSPMLKWISSARTRQRQLTVRIVHSIVHSGVKLRSAGLRRCPQHCRCRHATSAQKL